MEQALSRGQLESYAPLLREKNCFFPKSQRQAEVIGEVFRETKKDYRVSKRLPERLLLSGTAYF